MDHVNVRPVGLLLRGNLPCNARDSFAMHLNVCIYLHVTHLLSVEQMGDVHGTEAVEGGGGGWGWGDILLKTDTLAFWSKKKKKEKKKKKFVTLIMLCLLLIIRSCSCCQTYWM